MDSFSKVSRICLFGILSWNFSVVSFFLAFFGVGLELEFIKNGLILDNWIRDLCAGDQYSFFGEARKFQNLPSNQRKSMDDQNCCFQYRELACLSGRL